jgi:hypothetical protein
MIWARRLIYLFLILFVFVVFLDGIEHVPYFYLSLILFLILIVSAIRSRGSSIWKASLINLAAIVLAIGLAEGYVAGWQGFGFSPKMELNNVLFGPGGSTKRFPYYPFPIDNVRGYSMPKGARIKSIATFSREKVYDVDYTSNQYGLRISPHDINKFADLPKDYQNIACFGCSCTFGIGVNDNEAWPYLIEEQSKGKFRTYNFALGGYGPHQMLRMLQTGFLDTVNMKKKPVAAIYLAITDHIARSACKYNYFIWDINGPRYELNSSDKLEYAGKFNDGLISKIKFWIFRKLAKSYLISNSNWIKNLLGWNISQKDEDRYIHIIMQSKETFTKRYGGRFYVILWGYNIWYENTEMYKYILSTLKKDGIYVIESKDIFANDNLKDKDIYLIKHDGHPNKLANEKIAKYMINYIDNDLGRDHLPALEGPPHTEEK